MSKNLLINTNDMSIFESRRYYQEYEGTFITATDKSEDDTIDTSRFIEVTEIWGNTVQDEENLEDIQSIGELYVNEDGQPILDELGREQYKVEIENCNKNLFNKNVGILENTIINSNGVIGSFNGDFLQDVYIRIKPNTNYTFSTSVVTNKRVAWYDEDKVFINRYSNGTSKFTTKSPSNAKYLRYSGGLSNIDEVQIEEDSVKTDFIPNQSHKTTILLPCQLQKVGNVYDRLYWDSEKGRYVVEKNIVKYEISSTDSKVFYKNSNKTHSPLHINPNDTTGWNTAIGDFIIISNYSKSVKGGYLVEYNNIYGSPNKQIIVIVENSIYDDNFAEWVNKYKPFMFRPTTTSQLIETNITKKILLPCYEEKTHIFVSSTVDATMKVLVPYKEIL